MWLLGRLVLGGRPWWVYQRRRTLPPSFLIVGKPKVCHVGLAVLGLGAFGWALGFGYTFGLSGFGYTS